MFRKNVSGQFVTIAAINASTGAALTGATVSARRCLDGTFAAVTGTITEDTGTGFYKFAASQADTNGNNCSYFFTATSMIPVSLSMVTTAADPTDAVRFGLTALPNVASGSAGAVITSGTGTAQLSVSSGLVTLAGVTHTGAVIPTVTTLTGHTAQTGDSFARIGATGSGLTSLAPAATALSTAVWTGVPTGFLAATFPTGTIANTTNITAGTITTTTNLTNAATAGDFTATMKTSIGTAVAASAVASVTGNVGGNVTGSVGSVSGLTNSTITDAVLDELLSGHATSGSVGEALSAAGGAGDPWITYLPGSYVAGQAGYIVGTFIDAAISAASGLDAAGVRAAIGLASANLDTQLGAIDTVVDAVLVDTAEIGAAGAGLTALASAANLATVAGYLDTEVAAIKAKTDNLPAAPAAVGDVPSAASIADAVLDEALSSHTTAGTAGAALRDADLRGSRTVVRGTVGAGSTPSTTQFTPSALSPAGVAADQFKGRIIVWDNDTATTALRGQATDITASTGATLPLLTFTALTTAPSSGDTFSIV